MKIKVVSYSYTGNNEGFAAEYAKAIGAEHLQITEPKKRTPGKIIRENLFNRDPKVNLSKGEVSEDDFVIFFGPFWFGKMASPLKSFFKQLNGKAFSYGFVSLCVGFDTPEGTQKLKEELKSLTGREAEFVILKRIADLLPADPEPTQDMLTKYRVNDAHLQMLTASLKEEIGGIPA